MDQDLQIVLHHFDSCNLMILAIRPDSPDEIRDIGLLEEKMFNHEKSIEFLNRYPNNAARKHIQNIHICTHMHTVLVGATLNTLWGILQ